MSDLARQPVDDLLPSQAGRQERGAARPNQDDRGDARDYGYRRITVLLRRERIRANAKRVFRLDRLAQLGLRRRRPRRRRSAVLRAARVVASRPNEVWSMDFVHDRLADGRAVRFLTVVDAHTRECIALEVRRGWKGDDVAAVLTRAIDVRQPPIAITCDNGSEFCAEAMDRWAYRTGVKLDYSRPGKPTDNAIIESFNAPVRRELLNAVTSNHSTTL